MLDPRTYFAISIERKFASQVSESLQLAQYKLNDPHVL